MINERRIPEPSVSWVNVTSFGDEVDGAIIGVEVAIAQENAEVVMLR